MKFWALIDNSIVTTLVFQQEKPTIHVIGNWVESPDQYTVIGSTYTGGEFVSSKPVVVPPPLPVIPDVITKTAMLNRMTDAEFIGVINAAKTDAEVDLWKTRFDAAATFDLKDGNKVITGFSMLVNKGLLTQTRATKILTDPIRSEERP